MSTQPTYTILISEEQRAMLEEAMDEWVGKRIGSSTPSGDVLQEGMNLHDMISNNPPLEEEGINFFVL